MDLKNGVEIREYKDEGYRYLRVTDITNNGLQNNSIKRVAVSEIPKRIRLSKEDILISRSGSLGIVSIVTDEIIDSILSSHIFKVLLNSSLTNPKYIEAFLRSTIGQFQFFQNNNGGIIPEINQTALKSIQIIIPPLAKQNKIAECIQDIHQQVNKLRLKAELILSETKKEIEQMILEN